ncbi:hypothetical protein K8Z61_18435 [Nocardioides sp. TRM66260-LWL]|uniref:hypothetical protein n=1 Tax=Nocardioides sp. TRM66260-LWL TaxID=2874478 RepID=UPI001CC565F5|nr:hypothetical protein [Nocardioides sp. TRM66260-LWL]MBZ5736473.1 hypothetical protein [Nocardioides sp. TRM66260-LWL]
MDGPSHYTAAEQLLARHTMGEEPRPDLVARAQVHATLAHAAAVIEAARARLVDDLAPAWRETLR